MPAWVDSKTFKSITTLLLVAVAVLEASQYEWAPGWARIIAAGLAVFGIGAANFRKA